MKSNERRCTHCGELNRAWITTCPACGTSHRDRSDADVDLASEPAPALRSSLRPGDEWIDLPVSSDEPVRVALLIHFLNEREIEFSESHRFVSVPRSDAPRLIREVLPWAFSDDLPPDPRLHDTLAITLRSLGVTVLEAVERATALPIDWPDGVVREGVDLR